ncbi:flagellar hook-associated protein 1 FlgK [Scopulibacillus daqui]|uniref:Flagellar hook-associated protein 1 n=1 Tax=Scopulibacillus daqui TaxID=1469162 RepID=A0ABS2PYM7_9BACL|nr:flagellar hook-associated protein FlgK [Scopulibacillus daqui]MBM7645038.1 flagellar hook-associated protein 1 FlgK [Scopulibacillus daqui]
MVSTFGSLETGRRGLAAQQGAIHTTGNNIANANTEGYSRQRVNFSPSKAFPPAGFDQPMIRGQFGTGVDIKSVQRIRDQFADNQYRDKFNQNDYWETKSGTFDRVEDVLNELSDDSLSKAVDGFWQALQDLASNPENTGVRSIVRERGRALAGTFNHLSYSLDKIKDDLNQQINMSVHQVNALGQRIIELNKQIAEVEQTGQLPNGLYDERDRLVDQLSGLINIRIDRAESGGNSSALAEGKYTVVLLDEDGHEVGAFIDGERNKLNELSVNAADKGGQANVSLSLGGLDISGKRVPGKLQGLIEGYEKDLPDLTRQLDDMAYTLAQAFNKVHEQGEGLEGSKKGVDFFSGIDQKDGAAKNIKISDDIENSLNNIATRKPEAPIGDNSIIDSLVKVLSDQTLTFDDGTKGTLKSYIQSMIGNLGVNVQTAQRMAKHTDILMQNADQRRQSVSGVSLDEEMINLIQYQQAYTASARMINVVNDMLDTLINKMGV